MRSPRNVKIVATVGPASDTIEMLRKLVDAGVNVFRLNMSHGSHESVAELHRNIRQVEEEVERPICILADLQGPKIRCGVFEDDAAFMLEDGQSFRFDLSKDPGNSKRVSLPHPEIFSALKPNSSLLVNDGRIRLRVQECDTESATCIIEVGGEISNKKGVNVPDVVLPVAALSKKDTADLEFVCELGVDWLALSFVQRPEDVEEARTLARGRARILSKIEKPAAVDDFDRILEASDGIMVARGDLGVELPVEHVPPVQKHLISKCRAVGKPVIVATQMLESMISSPVPTRAEVSDVATAIYDGADAIMLSAESAAGDYPVEAVSTMDAVALKVESDTAYRASIETTRPIHRTTVSEAITSAARELTEATDLKAICCFTQSGTTAALAARERPNAPIIAMTPKKNIAREMCLYWGLKCVETREADRFKTAVIAAVDEAKKAGFAKGSDMIAITAGIPFNVAGSTNILRVASVDEDSLTHS